MAVDIALFVSKRLMPVAAALLLLAAAQLALALGPSPAAVGSARQSHEVRVAIGR